MATRFGEVRRRMYTDSEGNSRFPLDEYLGLRPKQLASPSMTESVVAMAADMPYRKVAETVSALTAGELSPKTVHRLLQSVGEEALAEEQERWEAQFEPWRGHVRGSSDTGHSLHRGRRGVDTPSARRAKALSVKCGIAYRGWRRIAEDRFWLARECTRMETTPYRSGRARAWSGPSSTHSIG